MMRISYRKSRSHFSTFSTAYREIADLFLDLTFPISLLNLSYLALDLLLFEVRNEIVAPLTRLFKLSVDTATIPYDWKIGEITVIHRNGSKANDSNYRPVSLTSVVCEIV